MRRDLIETSTGGAATFFLMAFLAAATPAGADGSFPLLLPQTGCFGIASYGIPLFDTGQGTVTVNPPGPILGVYLHWVGSEDDTPATAGTSTLTVNGVAVIGQKPPPPADVSSRFSWFSVPNSPLPLTSARSITVSSRSSSNTLM